MSAPNGNQADTSQEGLFALAILFGFVSIGGWVLWHFFGPNIAYYVMYARYYQALVFADVSAHAHAAVSYISTTPADRVTPMALIELGNAAMRYWSAIAAVLIGALYWSVRSRSTAWIVQRFRRFGSGNNLEQLISIQAHEWKTILPITVDNPADEKDVEAQQLYAEALHPEEWLKAEGVKLNHGGIDLAMTLFMLSSKDSSGKELFTLDLLAVAWGDGRIPIDENGFASPDAVRKFIDQYRPKLLPELRATPRPIRHRGKDFLVSDTHLVSCVCLVIPIFAALTRQFNTTWNGYGRLAPHAKVLAAAMLYRGAVERVLCHNMLLEIAEIWTKVRAQHKGKGTWTVAHFHEALADAEPLMEMSRHAFNLANGAPVKEYVANISPRQIAYMTKDKPLPARVQLLACLSPSKIKKAGGVFSAVFPRKDDLAARRKRIEGLAERFREGRGVCDNHSFQETAIASLYDWAKKKGSIMAPAEFMWLRAADRPLWYVLNSNGRPKPFIEAAGVHAHWVAETEMGAPLQIPQVAQAARGIIDYFYDKWVEEKGL